MTVPESIWTAAKLDTLDKLILGIISVKGDITPAEIATEIRTTQKRVKQKITRMAKEGWLTITQSDGKVHMEVCYGRT